MLLFRKASTGNYFGVNNKAGKIEFLSNPTIKAFFKYSHYVDGIDIITIKDDDELTKLRKIVATGILKDVPIAETKKFLLDNYTELFI